MEMFQDWSVADWLLLILSWLAVAVAGTWLSTLIFLGRDCDDSR